MWESVPVLLVLQNGAEMGFSTVLRDVLGFVKGVQNQVRYFLRV